MSEWKPIENGRIAEYEVVLTQHEDDLYPVAAYRIGNVWHRETEGPEDIQLAGRHYQLYRTPTHYQCLPTPQSRERRDDPRV